MCLYIYIYIHTNIIGLRPRQSGLHAVGAREHDIYIYIYIYVCMYMYMCLYIYIYIYTHIFFQYLPFNNDNITI